MARDLRICFVGDSFVAGVGDPLCLGWPGRLAARTFADGQPLTERLQLRAPGVGDGDRDADGGGGHETGP